MSKNIPIDWFKHLPEAEQEDFKKLLLTSPVTRRFRDLLREKEDVLDRQELNLKDYDSPSWSHKQADRNGYRRCLKEFNDLLNFLKG